MKTLLLLWLPFGSLFTSKQVPQNAKWAFRDPLNNIKSKESHKFKNEKTSIPFFWVNFECSVIDSMIDKGRDYDSLMKRREIGLNEGQIPGVMVFLPDSTRLFYAETNTVKIGKCDYSYQTFEIYPKLEEGGENIYELFYLKGVGFFAAVYVDIERSKYQRKHYVLEDLVDKKGKSVIDRSKLRSLTDTVFLIRSER